MTPALAAGGARHERDLSFESSHDSRLVLSIIVVQSRGALGPRPGAVRGVASALDRNPLVAQLPMPSTIRRIVGLSGFPSPLRGMSDTIATADGTL